MIHPGCVLKLGAIGLNHKTADLRLREAMAKGASGLAGEKALFFPHPTVLLSTCNRTEIYFSSDDLAASHSDLLSFLRRHIEEPFEHRLYSYFGLDCFVHLSRVASGIDSAILAETEIQRQVKVAYEQAKSIMRLPSCLHFAFQKALKVGKGVRTQFSHGAPSLPATIWEIAKRHFPDLESKKILFVGYSDMNRTLLSSAMRKELRLLTLCTREPAALRLPGCNVVGREILSHWSAFDLILSASKSDHYLLTGKSSRPHLIFDLSVPRNVDPALASGAKTRLYNIEQLNAIIDEKQRAQAQDFEQCEEMIWDRAALLARIYRESRLRSTQLETSIG